MSSWSRESRSSASARTTSNSPAIASSQQRLDAGPHARLPPEIAAVGIAVDGRASPRARPAPGTAGPGPRSRPRAAGRRSSGRRWRWRSSGIPLAPSPGDAVRLLAGRRIVALRREVRKMIDQRFEQRVGAAGSLHIILVAGAGLRAGEDDSGRRGPASPLPRPVNTRDRLPSGSRSTTGAKGTAPAPSRG